VNRYSLVFALLVASTFAVHPSQGGHDSAPLGQRSYADHDNGSGTNAKKSKASATRNGRGDGRVEPAPAAHDAKKAIESFVGKASSHPDALQHIQVLFVTVPHPIETHLAAAFDHNVDALQTGLQDAGYLFDSSVIPWEAKRERDDFSDDELEKESAEDADRTPGLLLFRKWNSTDLASLPYVDPYAHGLMVFLLSEKPTKGIEKAQAETAWDILEKIGIRTRPLAQGSIAARSQSAASKSKQKAIEPIRILGPSFSGSLDSLIPIVRFLHGKDPVAPIFIRSPGVTGGDAARLAVGHMAKDIAPAKVDFGSVYDNYPEWIDLSTRELGSMGIEKEFIAVLSEDESLFGGLSQRMAKLGAQDASQSGLPSNGEKDSSKLKVYEKPKWAIGFPRDISSLRAGYAQQGVFEPSAPAQQWKRFLNLKAGALGEGDSVRSFGGEDTTATQEAILFGISEFLKKNSIRAVILTATNEDDRIFLTQFLHANNPGLRVAIVGSTRLFLRGSMAQFRGDLIVDNFPMFPLLHEWTGAEVDSRQHIFADDESEGTYFSALDLMAEPHCPVNYVDCVPTVLEWYPEYSEPRLGGVDAWIAAPPVYIGAIGNDTAWPVAEATGAPLSQDKDAIPGYAFRMPFTLFSRAPAAAPLTGPNRLGLRVSSYWRFLFVFLIVAVATYCGCILYANPITRDQFASLQPSPSSLYWMLKIAVPGALAGAAFWVMAWAVAIPANASAVMPGGLAVTQTRFAWLLAAACVVLAPLAIIATAVVKWKATREAVLTPKAVKWVALAMLAAGGQLACLIVCWIGNDQSVSSALSTFREMHWESGLSLIPTAMFFILAVVVWAGQAGNGGGIIDGALFLPKFRNNERISRERGEEIRNIGLPLPGYKAQWLWLAWGLMVGAMALAHFFFGPFVHLTTLDSFRVTFVVRAVGAGLALLVVLDVLQFLWLWDELRKLLLALSRERFKRSFVSIREFDWHSLWSFGGISLQSMRTLRAKTYSGLDELVNKHGFKSLDGQFRKLSDLRGDYSPLDPLISQEKFEEDSATFCAVLVEVGDRLADWISIGNDEIGQESIRQQAEAIERMHDSKGDGSAYSEEEAELALLPEKNRAVEHFICLMYIGFIQSIVARLRTLLIAIASVFSLIALGVAIYPFVPISAPLTLGVALLLFIAWAFFRVFSQMDTDPILSRIVNGDDRKLQGSFYFRFAEAMALPLLTAGSALLPGGVGRLLELVQSFLSQGH
jgi:hypothetical protein